MHEPERNEPVAPSPGGGLAGLIAASRERLLLWSLIISGVAVGYGFVGDYLTNVSGGHPLLNIGLVTLQLLLVLAAGWCIGILVGTFTFGDRWRRRAVLGEKIVEEGDLVDMRGFHEGSFFVGFVALIGAGICYLAVYAATDDWVGRYNRAGAYVTLLKHGSEADRVDALRDLVHPSRADAGTELPVRAALAAALADPSPEVRRHAAWACGHLVVVDCQPGLLAQLERGEPAVREQAAIALGRLADAIGEREMLALLPASLGDDAMARALMTGLGLMGSEQGATRLAAMLGLLPPDVEAVALWAIGRARITSVRAQVLSLDPGDDLGRRCAIAEALKHVTTVEDDTWLRRRFNETPRGQECEQVELRDIEFAEGYRRDDIVYVVGEDLREKYMRAIFNIAGGGLEEWLRQVLADETEDLELRLLAERMLDLLRGAPARLPRE